MRDIDQLCDELRVRFPSSMLRQLEVSHPADDAGPWFFTGPQFDGEIQIESPNGMCPFLIEADRPRKSLIAQTVKDAIAKIEALVEFLSKK
jgi:hypothetical protein